MPLPPPPTYTPTKTGGLCVNPTLCFENRKHDTLCIAPTPYDREFAAMFEAPPCKELLWDKSKCDQPLPCPDHGIPPLGISNNE